MASLYDVAKEAGVSKTLVSRVLNNQSGVSPDNRTKINAAMEKLQYVPNALARSLVLQKTNMLGVVLDSLCEPYYFDFIRGVESGVDLSGQEALFCSGRSLTSAKERAVEFFAQGRVDGVIIYGSNISDIGLIRRLSKRTFPFVIVENEADFPDINSIRVDNVLGGEMAVNHLVEQGCHNIWHFTGDTTQTITQSRQQGYLQGMRNNGLTVTPRMIVTSRFEEAFGYMQMKQLLSEHADDLPDGIFFSADITAVGAITALLEAGIKIPQQIKIVGFDNDIYCTANRTLPGLTTLDQPLKEMGNAAVTVLLNAIHNPTGDKQNLVFTPKLIVRETSVAML